MILPHGFRRFMFGGAPRKNGVNIERVASARGHRGRIFISKGGILCA